MRKIILIFSTLMVLTLSTAMATPAAAEQTVATTAKTEPLPSTLIALTQIEDPTPTTAEPETAEAQPSFFVGIAFGVVLMVILLVIYSLIQRRRKR